MAIKVTGVARSSQEIIGHALPFISLRYAEIPSIKVNYAVAAAAAVVLDKPKKDFITFEGPHIGLRFDFTSLSSIEVP